MIPRLFYPNKSILPFYRSLCAGPCLTHPPKPQLALLTFCFRHGINKHDVFEFVSFKMCWYADFVTFGQSQARFPLIQSLCPAKWLLAPATYLICRHESVISLFILTRKGNKYISQNVKLGKQACVITSPLKIKSSGVVAERYAHMHLLDVVQTSRVWFENGRVMEHLIKSDTQEDYIQLKHTQTCTS